MTRKSSKAARAARVSNTKSLLHDYRPDLRETVLEKTAVTIENTAFEILTDTNNVHSYRHTFVSSLFDILVQYNVEEFVVLYAPLGEFVNPLEMQQNDPRIPLLTQEELTSITPPLVSTKLSDKKLAELIGVPVGEWLSLMHCSRCKGPAELLESRQIKSADEGQTLSLRCNRCNLQWKQHS